MKTFDSCSRSLTQAQVTEIGNRGFRIYDKDHPMKYGIYTSKMWRLHLLEDKKGIEKIAIVDERSPLLNISDLWPEYYDDKGFKCNHRSYEHTWIEIDKNLVVEQYCKISLVKPLVKETQYHLFTYLEKLGFMGDTLDLTTN